MINDFLIFLSDGQVQNDDSSCGPLACDLVWWLLSDFAHPRSNKDPHDIVRKKIMDHYHHLWRQTLKKELFCKLRQQPVKGVQREGKPPKRHKQLVDFGGIVHEDASMVPPEVHREDRGPMINLESPPVRAQVAVANEAVGNEAGENISPLPPRCDR